MKLYGIFDQNNNYKLLRYSTDAQINKVYRIFNYKEKTYSEIYEVCLPDIEYSKDFVGKFYNLETKTFQN